MRLPDRPWGETSAYGADGLRGGWDHQARSDDLAERMTRLLAGHPSADLRADPYWRDWDPDDPVHDDLGAEDFSPEDLAREDDDPDGLPPDDPASGNTGSGGDVTGGFGPRRTGDALWADSERTPYQPWFGADGAGDPWFAEPTDWADL